MSDSDLSGPTRRRLLRLATGAIAATAVPHRARAATPMQTPVKAIAFDGFVIFDPKPIFARVEEFFPGKGEALVNLWRSRQFEYCWLRTLTGNYADFWAVTGEALTFAAAAVKVDLTTEKRDRLMQGFPEMKAHPDVKPALDALRAAGIRLAFLSNLTEKMLAAAIASAGLDGTFEQLFSTDRVRAYKPDPRAYHMAIDGFGLRREEIVFAAFGGWDANGAKSFGYRTYWANRLGLLAEELGAKPDVIGGGVAELVRFATGAG